MVLLMAYLCKVPRKMRRTHPDKVAVRDALSGQIETSQLVQKNRSGSFRHATVDFIDTERELLGFRKPSANWQVQA